MLTGSCHCGALTIRLDTAKEPAPLPVRTCGCVAEATRLTTYDSEDVAARTARRARGWTPARLVVR